MRVLMVGVDKQTKGGMWTVAENYLRSEAFVAQTGLEYISTSITGSAFQRVVFTAGALMKIFAKLIRCRYDIVHVHMAERGSVYRKNIVICLAKLFGCRVVVHMHGAEFETWYQTLSEKKKQGVRRILCKADRLLILGYYWQAFIQSLISDPNRVRVLHNAVDVPGENHYNPEACNMLFLGVVGRRKGILDLLDAVKLAEPQLQKNARLMVCGLESDVSIRAAIAERGLAHRVEYRGWLSEDDRAEVLRKTAVNILPSYNEGLPMTILETMAQGIPNITTNVAAIPEAVDQENGLVLSPGDTEGLAQAILKLMNDPVARKQKSQAAYEKAKLEFSIKKHIISVLDIYRELEPET